MELMLRFLFALTDKDLEKIKEKNQYKAIEAIYPHPCYYNERFPFIILNDIALIEVSLGVLKSLGLTYFTMV